MFYALYDYNRTSFHISLGICCPSRQHWCSLWLVSSDDIIMHYNVRVTSCDICRILLCNRMFTHTLLCPFHDNDSKSPYPIIVSRNSCFSIPWWRKFSTDDNWQLLRMGDFQRFNWTGRNWWTTKVYPCLTAVCSWYTCRAYTLTTYPYRNVKKMVIK